MATAKATAPHRPTVRVFPTWGDALRCVETQPRGVTSRASETGDYHFCRTHSLSEALALAHSGWEAGAVDARAISSVLEARLLPRIVKDDINYDVEGMALDVARLTAGEPEHWICVTESTERGHGAKHVQITVELGVSCGIRAESITARGAALCALVTLLEYADCRVELWAQQSSGQERVEFVDRIRVKAYDQPLDEARVAFALSHPSMLRRICFALMERPANDAIAPVCQRITSASYGRPLSHHDDEASLNVIGMDLADGHVDWNNTASVEAWIIAELAKSGVILADAD